MLPVDRHSVDSNGDLILTNLQPTDRGAYFCKPAKTKLDSSKPTNVINLSLNLDDNFVFSTRITAASTQSDARHVLPLAPTQVRFNVTEVGVDVSWQPAVNSPAAIAYYQVYYRQAGQLSWKTTEAIQPEQTRHFIDKTRLRAGHVRREYQLKIIAFSAFSKSLPSQIYTFTFVEQSERRVEQQTYISTSGLIMGGQEPEGVRSK